MKLKIIQQTPRLHDLHMKKTLVDRYEELVPGTIDRLDKSDDEKAKELEDSLTCETCGHWVSMHDDGDKCYSCEGAMCHEDLTN